MSLVLTSVQKVSLAIEAVDAAGNPAPIDGAPVWSVSDETVLELQVGDDGLSAVAVTKGPLGSAQVVVSADADLGEGVVSISGLLDIEVVAAQAVALAIKAGTPESRI
jgi:hypothetical protein